MSSKCQSNVCNVEKEERKKVLINHEKCVILKGKRKKEEERKKKKNEENKDADASSLSWQGLWFARSVDCHLGMKKRPTVYSGAHAFGGYPLSPPYHHHHHVHYYFLHDDGML